MISALEVVYLDRFRADAPDISRFRRCLALLSGLPLNLTEQPDKVNDHPVDSWPPLSRTYKRLSLEAFVIRRLYRESFPGSWCS